MASIATLTSAALSGTAHSILVSIRPITRTLPHERRIGR